MTLQTHVFTEEIIKCLRNEGAKVDTPTRTHVFTENILQVVREHVPLHDLVRDHSGDDVVRVVRELIESEDLTVADVFPTEAEELTRTTEEVNTLTNAFSVIKEQAARLLAVNEDQADAIKRLERIANRATTHT